MNKQLTDANDISAALTAVGELLEAEGENFTIIIIGGAAMSLLRLGNRMTTDVDILAWGPAAKISRPPQPLPDALVRAAGAVGDRLGLPQGWLNAGPASQWDTGLPPGLSTRIRWRDFRALRVGIVDRYDLIFFKVYAAADDTSRGRHFRDLLSLRPSEAELAAAVNWVITTQDSSPGFVPMLDSMLQQLRQEIAALSN